MYVGLESRMQIDCIPATIQILVKKRVAEKIEMIDNEQSHKMRRYARWIKDIRADCDQMQADRDAFRNDLMSFSSGI